MKAITLWEPYASLIPLGEKEYETRSWKTDYRGLLVIHSAKSDASLHMCSRPFFREALLAGGYHNTSLLPRGCGLCVVELLGCYTTAYIGPLVSEKERAFGDFSRGRYAWKLRVVERFAEPIPVSGAQGLWDWNKAVQAAALRKLYPMSSRTGSKPKPEHNPAKPEQALPADNALPKLVQLELALC